MDNSDWLQKDFKEEELKEVKEIFLKNVKKSKSESELEFIRNNLNSILFIVHIFSNDPLTTQEEILKKLSISKEKLLKINKVIKNIDVLQELILKKGSGERYWNSILPFAKYTKNVIENNFNLPIRIAFFPGVSCMFYCGFCGRKQSEKYPLSIVDDSLKTYEKGLIKV